MDVSEDVQYRNLVVLCKQLDHENGKAEGDEAKEPQGRGAPGGGCDQPLSLLSRRSVIDCNSLQK